MSDSVPDAVRKAMDAILDGSVDATDPLQPLTREEFAVLGEAMTDNEAATAEHQRRVDEV